MTRKRSKLMASVLALALTVAACGGGDSEEPAASGPDSDVSADGEPSAGSDPSDATDPAADGEPAADQLDPDGVLKVATFAIYDWDPDTINTSYAITMQGLVFDRLVHTAPDGGLVPGLATDWQYSDDGKVLTLTLREGVEFQDGTPFDAEVAKANLDRSRTHEASAHLATLGRIDEVTVADPYTLELHLPSPDASLPAVLSGSAGAMMSLDSMDDPESDQQPVGTGMFKLVEHVPGTSFSVERWDGYWDPEAVKLAAIEFTALPDAAARVNALKTGAVDIAPLEPNFVEDVENSDGVSVQLNDTLRYVYLAMNLGKEPVDNLLVRQAISHAIDRETLLQGLYGGYGSTTEQPWPAGYFPHVDDLDETYPYDPERARELLAEAGYPDGFSANIIAVPTPAVYAQLGEAVQAQLAEVGIDLTVQVTEPAELGPAMYIDKTAEFALLYTNGSLDPANTIGARYTAEGFFNPGGYSTPRLEELYQESLTTSDDEARTNVLQDVSREVVEQVLDMPLFFAQEPEGVNDRVVGYESFLSGRPEFRGVGVAG